MPLIGQKTAEFQAGTTPKTLWQNSQPWEHTTPSTTSQTTHEVVWNLGDTTRSVASITDGTVVKTREGPGPKTGALPADLAEIQPFALTFKQVI